MKNKLQIFSLLFSILWLFAACQGENTDNQVSDNENVNLRPGNEDENRVALEKSYKFLKADTEVASIVSGENAKLIFGSIELESKRSGEKNKYYDKKGNLLAEVKYKEGSFKVRDQNSNLLWKVKLYDDKVKISDNEENENPYQIKFSSDEKAKVYLIDNEIGTVRDKTEFIEIANEKYVFTIDERSIKLAYGVLLLDKVANAHKLIIMNELLMQKK